MQASGTGYLPSEQIVGVDHEPMPIPFFRNRTTERTEDGTPSECSRPPNWRSTERGHKGTGKSTAARGLAQLLPPIEMWEDSPFNSDAQDPAESVGLDYSGKRRQKKISRPMPFVELPLNATEDRLVGSLHLEKALQTGARSFEPGIRPVLVVISDGEANVPISAGAEPLDELTSLAELIAHDRIPAIFIDAAAQAEGESEMQHIAGLMQASFIHMSALSAATVLKAVLDHQ
jgi:hypothetical protein